MLFRLRALRLYTWLPYKRCVAIREDQDHDLGICDCHDEDQDEELLVCPESPVPLTKDDSLNDMGIPNVIPKGSKYHYSTYKDPIVGI